MKHPENLKTSRIIEKRMKTGGCLKYPVNDCRPKAPRPPMLKARGITGIPKTALITPSKVKQNLVTLTPS